MIAKANSKLNAVLVHWFFDPKDLCYCNAFGLSGDNKVRSSLLFLLYVSALFEAQAANKELILFKNVQAQARTDAGTAVSINKSIQSAEVEQSIRVDLPNGESLDLRVTKKERKPNRTIVIHARDSRETRMILTFGKRRIFGSISSTNFSYTLGFSPSSGQMLMDNRKSDASKVRLENDMVFAPRASNNIKPLPQEKSEKLNSEQGSDFLGTTNSEPQALTIAPADMTLLAVYSPEFAEGFGNDPEARIEQAIAFTNQALSDTNIDGQFRLVGTQEIDFDNSLTASTLLTQSQAGSNAFSSLPSLRNRYGADMVAVLAYRSDFSPNSDFAANGIAFVNGNNPNFAFSVSRLSLFCCDSVFAHELGHNLGSGHERAVVAGNPAGSCDSGFAPGGFTGFSCGYAVEGDFDTIMSRNIGTSINRFSNPQQSCNGVPCGIAQNSNNSADNFSSFNISAFLVEQFRSNTRLGNSNVVTPILPLLLDNE